MFGYKILITAALLLTGVLASGQTDSTLYINGLPVTEDDTVDQYPPGDLEPKNRLITVPADALPSDVRKALDNGEQYRGWRDSTVYFERNTGLYMVPVKMQDGIRTYGLDKNGKPVTFDEVSSPR